MNTLVKTLKVRVKDSKTSVLERMAFEVNQVWNAANAITSDYGYVPVPGVGWVSNRFSAFDIQKHVLGIREQRGLIIPSHTLQETVAVHAKSRKQFKTDKLRWRVSGGSRRALGWIPFKKGSAKWKGGQVYFAGHYFKVWDSYGLSQYEFRSGSFTQDARGRWYFNVAVEVAVQESTATGQIGIDLGLKTTAVCSDGTVLNRSEYYRKMENKLAKAQRANKKRQVKTIHAKVKNQRADTNHKFSTKLVKENALIVVGNVSSSKLAKTKMAKSVLDAGWYQLKQQLDYKSKAMQGLYIEVNEAYSTQVCSCCGCISPNSPKGRADLNKRDWTCSECGAEHDRDLNSAANILRLGHQTLAVGIPVL